MPQGPWGPLVREEEDNANPRFKPLFVVTDQALHTIYEAGLGFDCSNKKFAKSLEDQTTKACAGRCELLAT